MATADSKSLLQGFVHDVLDSKDLDAADKFLAPNFLHHDRAPGEETGQQTGVAGTKIFFSTTVFPAFSDFTTSFGDLIAEGDLVAGRWSQSVRHTGTWLGLPPSGRVANIGGISIARVRDGLIVEEWEARDTLGLLRQVGIAVPALRLEPGRAKSARPVIGPGVRALTNGPLLDLAPRAVPDAAKQVVGQFIFDAWNGGDLGVVDKLFAPDFALRNPVPGQVAGRDGVRQFIDGFRASFTDVTASADLILAEGSKVATRWTARGTQRAPFLGLPSKGGEVAVSGINLYTMRGDQIVEDWGQWDQASLLSQVGALKQ